MCGIAGIFSSTMKSVTGLDALAQDLLIMTQVRGTDATGLVVIDAEYKMDYNKKAVNAIDFLELKNTKRLLMDVNNAFATILHCRKKTLGGSGHAAAHPFVVSNDEEVPEFAMVHNGTLTKWNSAKHESDSHWLSSELYRDHKKTLASFNPRCAAALIWTDMRTTTNYFFTNGERPLFYGFLEKEEVLIVGSEAELMYAALMRNDMKLKNNEFFKALPMTLYSCDTNTVLDVKREEIKKEIVVQTGSQKSLYDDNIEDAEFYSAYGGYRPYYSGYNRGSFPTARETMLGELNAIYEKATRPSSLPALTAPVTPVKYQPTEQELKNFVDYTGNNRGIEIKGSIDLYDETEGELYLTVTDVSPLDLQRGVVLGDMVIMRDVSPAYYAFLEASLKEICVCIAGLVSPDKSIKEFVAKGRHLRTNTVDTEKPRMRLIN